MRWRANSMAISNWVLSKRPTPMDGWPSNFTTIWMQFTCQNVLLKVPHLDKLLQHLFWRLQVLAVNKVDAAHPTYHKRSLSTQLCMGQAYVRKLYNGTSSPKTWGVPRHRKIHKISSFSLLITIVDSARRVRDRNITCINLAGWANAYKMGFTLYKNSFLIPKRTTSKKQPLLNSELSVEMTGQLNGHLQLSP